MPFTPKNWQNSPSTATPIDADALRDLERRVTANVDGTTVDTGQQYRLIVLSDGTVRGIPADVVAPSPPTGLATVVRLTSVRLTWSPVASATKYAVVRSGVQLGLPSTVTYLDTTIVAGQTYDYTVATIDQYGQRSPASSPISAFINPTLNAAPTQVTITCWPTQIATGGTTIVRVNARDTDIQTLTRTLSVDSGSLRPTEDPSVWLLIL